MNTTSIIPDTEAAAYRSQMELAEKFSTTLEIKSENDYQAALAEGKHIKDQLEIITTRKEAITKPMEASLKSVKDLFKPWELAAKNALDVVKAKMLAYYNAKEAKADKKINGIIDKYEAGKLSEGEANAKIMMAAPAQTVTTTVGSATVKKVKNYYVVDKSKIPLQFMEPDMVKIKASFKAGTPVDGVEERLENQRPIIR